jgi:hypothetical protein
MTEILEYEVLVKEFEEALLTKLRGHGSSAGEYLSLWVPDTDPVKSIANMAEAAHLNGHGAIHLRVLHTTMDQDAIERLKGELMGLGRLEVTQELGSWLFVVYY